MGAIYESQFPSICGELAALDELELDGVAATTKVFLPGWTSVRQRGWQRKLEAEGILQGDDFTRQDPFIPTIHATTKAGFGGIRKDCYFRPAKHAAKGNGVYSQYYDDQARDDGSVKLEGINPLHQFMWTLENYGGDDMDGSKRVVLCVTINKPEWYLNLGL